MSELIEGKKLNMTQIFLDSGQVVPVTIITSNGQLNAELENKTVIVTGTSKGKGWTGVMKKWGFHGEQATRGQSTKPRSAGAIGSQHPKNVIKGKKMAGRMGNAKVTIKGLKIVRVLPEQKQFMVSGPVPGARNSEILVRIL
jgi:large subunit ribosomal protein L3